MPLPVLLQDMRARRAVPIAVAVFIAFASAVSFNGTSDPFLAIFMPVLFVLCGVLLWQGVKNGWPFPVTPAPLLLLAFWGYLAVSTCWSGVPYISHLFLVLIASAPLLFFAAILSGKPEKDTAALALGLGCGWIAFAIWALAQFYVLPATAGHRIAAPMLDPNNLAALFNMGLVPAASLFLAARRPIFAVASLTLYALMTMATIVTMSRAGLVIAIGCLILIMFMQRRDLMAARWKFAAYPLVPLCAYFLVNHKSHAFFSHTFTDLAHPARSPSVIDRRALLEGSLRMLAHHPFGDIGLGNFYYFYPTYRAPSDMSDGFFAHSDPLQFTLETGFPSILLLYAFLVAAAFRTVKAWRKLPRYGTERVVLAASGTALLSIMVHSHINYNLYMPGILIPVGVLLAVWYLATERADGMTARQRKTWPSTPRMRGAAMAAVAIICGLGAVSTLRTGLTSYMLNKADAISQSGDRAAAEVLADQIARFGNDHNFSVPEVQARMAMADFNAADNEDDKSAAARRGMAYVQQASAENPHFTAFMSLEAQFYYLGSGSIFPGGIQMAEGLLKRAVQLNPLDADARTGLAVVYEAEGRLQDALDILNAGVNWPRPKGQPDVDFYINLAHIHQLMGDDKGYASIMDYAQKTAQSYGIGLPPQ